MKDPCDNCNRDHLKGRKVGLYFWDCGNRRYRHACKAYCEYYNETLIPIEEWDNVYGDELDGR